MGSCAESFSYLGMHFIANSSWQAQRDVAPLKINMESSNRHHGDNYVPGWKEPLLGFSKPPAQKEKLLTSPSTHGSKLLKH